MLSVLPHWVWCLTIALGKTFGMIYKSFWYVILTRSYGSVKLGKVCLHVWLSDQGYISAETAHFYQLQFRRQTEQTPEKMSARDSWTDSERTIEYYDDEEHHTPPPSPSSSTSSYSSSSSSPPQDPRDLSYGIIRGKYRVVTDPGTSSGEGSDADPFEVRMSRAERGALEPETQAGESERNQSVNCVTLW